MPKKASFHVELNGIGQLDKTDGVNILLNTLCDGPREALSASEGYLNVPPNKKLRQGFEVLV